jgi:hypothetical protein
MCCRAGQQKAVKSAMLKIVAGAATFMLRFQSFDERDEVSAAIVEAQARKAAAEAAAATAAAAPAAGPAVAAGSGQTGSQLTVRLPAQQRADLLKTNT